MVVRPPDHRGPGSPHGTSVENRLLSERARLGRRSAPGLGRAPSARRRRAAARAPLRRASPGLSERGTAHGTAHAAAVAAAAAARLLVLGSPAADADLFVALEGLLLHEQ